MDYVEELAGAGVSPVRFVRRKLPLIEELRRLSVFLSNYTADAQHHHQRQGDVFCRRLGAPSVYLCHPRLVQHVLRTNVLNYPKGPDYDLLRPLIGDGILVSEGEVWTRQRRLLAPEFRLDQVARFLPTINAELAVLADHWRAAAAEGQSVDVGHSMQGFALRVLGNAIFRSDFANEAAVIGEALEICLAQGTKQMLSMGLLPPWLPTPGNRRARAAEHRLNRSVRRLIDDGRVAQARGGCPFASGGARAGEVDMLTRMLDARHPDTNLGMSDQHLLDEIKSLILAGHETSGLVLSWALYLLARHPEIEARVLAEAERVLGGRPAQPEDVESLVVARQVVLETMRLYPPVPGVTRRAVADDAFEGIEVRAGESVTILPYVIHRHPEFWADPERFNPDRFAPDRVDAIDPYSYLPFVRGRRACLGEHFAMIEIIVALATIVSRFQLTRVDDDEIGVRPISTLRLARPLLMRPRAR
ncbi:cytochrome P450 [Enhygromyxa salina]|uniref:Pentalenene oxygenase n=1 Tax=Enhygromyxa salina TaxID=215803 RepID=A0A2S9XN38_9BACT|nr:cytochrome P450 [Enhygromyxa salina]PRP94275.1 Pentalenene oxygenase [Enhygromyxa salina]